MLWVCDDIKKFNEFREIFQKTHESLHFLDLSKISSSELSNEGEAIVSHHTSCIIFLGHLEPGWMLESSHQTRLRKLIRKFPVAMVTKYVDSIPFSWKNEIDKFYTSKVANGSTNTFNNGSAL
jgi:hypothetical protein